MAGALGTLGVLLEISLKILPRPEQELTLAFELPVDQAIATMNQWSNQPLPLSAACHMGNTLYVRMSGAGTALQAARAHLAAKSSKGEKLCGTTCASSAIRSSMARHRSGDCRSRRRRRPWTFPVSGSLTGVARSVAQIRRARGRYPPCRPRRRAAMPRCFAAATGKARCFTRCRPRPCAAPPTQAGFRSAAYPEPPVVSIRTCSDASDTQGRTI